jgi:PST family polysaccharide transporter
MKGKTLTHKTLSGLTWSFIGLGAQGLSQITILCILARFLSPEDFGLVGAALIVINFANIFHELSVGPAIVQRSVLEKRHIEAGFAVSVLVSLSLFGVVFLTIPAIEIFFKMPQLSPILKTMIIIIPINGMAVVSQSLLQRELKFRTIAVIEVASYIIGFGLVGIILAALEKGVWALVFAYLAQSFCKTVFLLAINRHAKRLALDFKALGDLMRLGFGFTLGGGG